MIYYRAPSELLGILVQENIISGMQDIQLIYAKNNTAKYRLRENELYGERLKLLRTMFIL